MIFPQLEKKLIIKINNGNDITIDGQDHTVDLKGSSKHDHYFVVKSGNVVFKNIIFVNGYNKDGDKGGAISFEGSAKGTIINCTFKNCWAEDHGGAVSDRTGNKLTVINSTFIGNSADDVDGGAIFLKGPIYAEGCLFEDNKADDFSGAVDINSGKLSIFKKCVFRSNRAGDDKGGAIYSDGNLEIEDCLFDSNKAKVDGGAIFCKKNVTVKRSVFINNKASGAIIAECWGGAICADGDVYIDNSTFENNSAGDYGGAIHAANVYINKGQGKQSINTFFRNNEAGDNDGGAIFCKGPIYAEYCLFEDNEAEEYSGAIDIDSDKLSIFKNCVFRSNRAGDDKGGAIFSDGNLEIEDCLFDSNKAKVDGGAIFCKKNVTVKRSVFINNKASGAIIAECWGGAICADGDVYIDNSTFENNSAGDYGGAIHAANVYINKGQGKQSINTFFRNNKAGDNDGGAIFVRYNVPLKMQNSVKTELMIWVEQ